MVEKNVKRFLVLGILGLFMISMMVGVVAPENGVNLPDPQKIGEDVAAQAEVFGKGVGAFFTGLFGDTLLGNDTLGKIFMALLIGMFVYAALGTFFKDDNKKWILNVATVAATGLAILGLPENFLKSVLTGYGAMGVAILMIVPFFIIFWFTVKVDSVLMAKGIWLFYTVYYFALFFQKLFTGGWTLVWPNLIAIVLGGIMFFFILGIRSFIFKGEMEEVVEKGTQKAAERKHRLTVEMERLKADE